MKVLSTIAAAAISDQYYAISIQQAEELLGGLIYGLIQKDDLKQIETCLTDADKVEAEINEAVTDIMKGDVQDIIAGISVIGQLLSELPVDLQDCQDIQGDVTRITNWIDALVADPVKLATMIATNVISNFTGITADISTTSSDIAKADYYSAGTDISDIVVLTLGAVPADDMTLY